MRVTLRELREVIRTTVQEGYLDWPGDFWCLVCGHRNNGYVGIDDNVHPPRDECENPDCDSRHWYTKPDPSEQFTDHEPGYDELKPYEGNW